MLIPRIVYYTSLSTAYELAPLVIGDLMMAFLVTLDAAHAAGAGVAVVAVVAAGAEVPTSSRSCLSIARLIRCHRMPNQDAPDPDREEMPKGCDHPFGIFSYIDEPHLGANHKCASVVRAARHDVDLVTHLGPTHDHLDDTLWLTRDT